MENLLTKENKTPNNAEVKKNNIKRIRNEETKQ